MEFPSSGRRLRLFTTCSNLVGVTQDLQPHRLPVPGPDGAATGSEPSRDVLGRVSSSPFQPLPSTDHASCGPTRWMDDTCGLWDREAAISGTERLQYHNRTARVPTWSRPAAGGSGTGPSGCGIGFWLAFADSLRGRTRPLSGDGDDGNLLHSVGPILVALVAAAVAVAVAAH